MLLVHTSSCKLSHVCGKLQMHFSQILLLEFWNFLYLFWLKFDSLFYHTKALPPYQGNTNFSSRNRILQIRSLSVTASSVRISISLQKIFFRKIVIGWKHLRLRYLHAKFQGHKVCTKFYRISENFTMFPCVPPLIMHA